MRTTLYSWCLKTTRETIALLLPQCALAKSGKLNRVFRLNGKPQPLIVQDCMSNKMWTNSAER